MYIFRNYTIENLFEESDSFSGYGDISYIPEADTYVWFYNVPLNSDPLMKRDEIKGIGEKLRMVSSQIPSTSTFFIFTLVDLFPINVKETDYSCLDAVEEVNSWIREYGKVHTNVCVVELNNFLLDYRREDWINWKFYFLSQMIFSPVLASGFKTWWKKQTEIFKGSRKKCLVLDLDNTLWKGVLGEDGISGVKMDGDYPGNAFMYFQEAIVELSKTGVIITICSKNNEEDVKELWEKNPFVKLTPEYISAYRINWQNKADNIRELAAELNIGLDSMVFVDDNPTERELVRQQLPMVSVPEFPKRPYDLMVFYRELVNNHFRAYRLTTEDLGKTEQYKANQKRRNQESKFSDLSDYIRSLDINIDIRKADTFTIPRIAQMSQKTNQFNLTTKRYTEADIFELIEKGADVFYISVKDRFGDNGITGEIIMDRKGDVVLIDTLLLSCRILGKNIEYAFVKSVLNLLRKEGVKTVIASYLPTQKNQQVADFYEKVGFSLEKEENGEKSYRLSLTQDFPIDNLYKISIKQ